MIATRSNAPYRNSATSSGTSERPAMNNNNQLRSRSLRNVTLPILERSGSTRNFRELPPDRRRGSALVGRRSNSTRRFFVDHQNSRGSAGTGTSSSSSGNTSSLQNHLRGMTLERSDSNSSMGSFQTWGSQVSTLGSLNNSNSQNNNSHSNHNSHSNNDSVFSGLTMDSNSRAQRSVTSRSEDDSMMSLFSRDSVKVRRDQLDISGHSTLLNNTNSNSNTPQGSFRDGMSVATGDDDMFSVASSECTVYSFDRAPPRSVLGPMSFHDSEMNADMDWP